MGIREKRLRAGMSKSELARRMGLRHTSVIRWENGQAKPSADHLMMLSAILDCTIDELLDRNASA